MKTLRMRGYPEDSTATESLSLGRFSDLIGYEPAREGVVRLARARDQQAGEIKIKDVEEGDVIELELAGGIRLYSTLGQLVTDYPSAVVWDEVSQTWTFDPERMPLGAARGDGPLKVLALRRLKVWIQDKLAGEAAKWTGRKIAKRIEDRLISGPGLYRCNSPDRLDLAEHEIDTLPQEQPLLLLIHGTGSTTQGSFGDLWREGQLAQWAEVMRRYNGHVYAFEHHTLSKSPIENAKDLVRSLPQGARLHIVSHSRGGLVGELLCRGQVKGRAEPFSAEEIRLFNPEGQGDNLEALVELNELLSLKRFRVDRFVRVACPARGTTLASRRLDRFLSVFFNLIGQIPLLKLSPVYEALSAFLLAVVKLRTDPEEIPGLEAQMPSSPHIALLNGSPVEIDADLSVIAGDFEGSGFFGRLKEFATNLYYWSRHDLVVNTEAMYGGGRRGKHQARYFFDDGRIDDSVVNHFHYFSNERTFRRVIAGLTRADDDPAGFRPFTTIKDIPESERFGARGGARPVVFVLPGILGSHLAVNGDRIWVDPPHLFLGAFKRLSIDATGVDAEALIGSVYRDLIEYLGGTHEVVAFPFDWRRTLVAEAQRLAEAIELRLSQTSQPIRILAHSMGGLVARAMIATRPQLWQEITAREGGRLLMLGTPNRGSFAIPRILLGQEGMLELLSVVDFWHGKKALLRHIARFPGILEMLPDWDASDYFQNAAWRQIKPEGEDDWPLPGADDLAAARSTRDLIAGDHAVDPQHMFYIAGQAKATPIGIKRDTNGQPVKPVRFIATRRGDGRVPWDWGIPVGVSAWFARVAHGDLPKRTIGPFEHSGVFEEIDNHFEAIREILEQGETDRLPKAPPAEREVQADGFELPPDEVQMYPDEAALVAAALGMQTEALGW
jgi:pimeloyl-ACP methyl ester carboxylesterase